MRKKAAVSNGRTIHAGLSRNASVGCGSVVRATTDTTHIPAAMAYVHATGGTRGLPGCVTAL